MNYYFVDNCTYLNMFRKYRTRTILDNKSSNNRYLNSTTFLHKIMQNKLRDSNKTTLCFQPVLWYIGC